MNPGTGRPTSIPTKTEMTRTALILAVSAYCHVNHESCTQAFAAVDRTVEQMRLMNSPPADWQTYNILLRFLRHRLSSSPYGSYQHVCVHCKHSSMITGARLMDTVTCSHCGIKYEPGDLHWCLDTQDGPIFELEPESDMERDRR